MKIAIIIYVVLLAIYFGYCLNRAIHGNFPFFPLNDEDDK